MKATTRAIVGVIATLLFMGTVAAAERSEDFKTFQKVVKANPSYEPGRTVEWFKVEVTDVRNAKTKVRITLPIALVDIVLKCMDDSRIHLDDSNCDLDVKSLWRELKKAGPKVLIEIRDGDGIVKVWFE